MTREEGPSDWLGAHPAGRRTALPTSPQDQEGMYHGVLWVAWAIEECSRAFTRISSRLGELERRLDRLDSASDVSAPRAASEAGAVDDSRLDRLESLFADNSRDSCRRLDRLEERLRQLEFVPLKLSNLQRSVDQVSAARRATASVPPASTAPRTSDVDRRLLQRDVAALDRRLSALEARASEESLSAAVEEAVGRQIGQVAPGVGPTSADLDGVYRELDAIAEFVSARAVSTAGTLERIPLLEIAVLELRRDLGRVLDELGTGSTPEQADPWPDEVETRLGRLELWERKAERLFSALHDAVALPAPDDPSEPEPEPERAVRQT